MAPWSECRCASGSTISRIACSRGNGSREPRTVQGDLVFFFFGSASESAPTGSCSACGPPGRRRTRMGESLGRIGAPDFHLPIVDKTAESYGTKPKAKQTKKIVSADRRDAICSHFAPRWFRECTIYTSFHFNGAFTLADSRERIRACGKRVFGAG